MTPIYLQLPPLCVIMIIKGGGLCAENHEQKFIFQLETVSKILIHFFLTIYFSVWWYLYVF